MQRSSRKDYTLNIGRCVQWLTAMMLLVVCAASSAAAAASNSPVQMSPAQIVRGPNAPPCAPSTPPPGGKVEIASDAQQALKQLVNNAVKKNNGDDCKKPALNDQCKPTTSTSSTTCSPQLPPDHICQMCTDKQFANCSTVSTVTTTETATGSNEVIYRDPVIYGYIKTVSSCLSTATASASATFTAPARIVPIPKNFRELQNAINGADLPEDIRSLLKALAIYNQDYVHDHMSKNLKQIIEEDATNNPPYETVHHVYPVGFDNSVPVAIMYYSNIFYICKDMPNDLKDLKY